MEYAYGKVPIKTEVTGGGGAPLLPNKELTEAELQAELKRRNLPEKFYDGTEEPGT